MIFYVKISFAITREATGKMKKTGYIFLFFLMPDVFSSFPVSVNSSGVSNRC